MSKSNDKYRNTEELSALVGGTTNVNDPWWATEGKRGGGRQEGGSGNVYSNSETIPRRTPCDLASFILYVLLVSCALIAGGISLGSGAYWTHALSGTPMANCFILMLSAGLPLALGIFILLFVTGIIVFNTCFCRMPHAALSNTGPTGRSCCARAVRVIFLHVIPAFLLLFGVVGSIAALYLSQMAHQQPDLNKDFSSVSGLDGPVTIQRDANGLVHVKASSRRDAVFGQGVAHGQDRLWQVEFQRLVGRGTLGKYVGSAGAKMDKQIRTLGFPAGAKRMCDNASPENRELLQRYVDGLNFYVDKYSERPAEFLFMGTSLLSVHKVEPFVPMDACLVAMLLMWQMGANIPTEIQRFKVFWFTERSYDEVNELYNNMTNITDPILSAEQLGFSEEDAVAARAREANDNAIERALYDGHIAHLRDLHNPSIKGQRFSAVPSSSSASSLEFQQERHHMRAADLASLEKMFAEKHFKTQGCSMGAAPTAATTSSSVSSPQEQQQQQAADKKASSVLSFLLKEFDLLSLNVHHASNSWAGRAPGDGTQSAVGASDPHLAINVPSVWYWSHLTYPIDPSNSKSAVYDAAGVGLPGLPGVHIGKTSFSSWGITMSMTDLGDLFIITPDPARPSTHYIRNNVSTPFTFRTEVIEVKGGDTITLTIPETVYGPIATEALGLPEALMFAVKTDFLVNDTTSVDGLFCLNEPTTRTAMDVRDKCLSRLRSPGFSIPIEDHEGNIAYSMTGLHPLRRAGHTGRYPTMGDGSFDSLGWIPFDELPTITITAAQSNANGGGGHISAANQKTYADGYKYTLGYDFCYPSRGGRLHERLDEASRTNPSLLSSPDFHIALQRDVRSNTANQYLSQILNVTYYAAMGQPVPAEVQNFFATMASTVGTRTAANSIFDRLSHEWDKEMRIGTTEGTLFFKWFRQLMAVPTDAIRANNMFSTKDSEDQTNYWSSMQEQYPSYLFLNPSPLMTRQCIAFVPEATSCGDMAARLFIQTTVDFSAEEGNVWGVDANQLTTKHLMLEGTILDCLFQRTVHKNGDFSTIDVSDFKFDKNFPSSFASSMRQIYDWSKPNFIYFMFPGGESGNPFSEFFQNLLQPYVHDQYLNVTAVAGDEVPIVGGVKFSQTIRP